MSTRISRVELAQRTGRQHRTRGNPDEGVQRIPERVEGGNLVGNELGREHDRRSTEYKWLLEHL